MNTTFELDPNMDKKMPSRAFFLLEMAKAMEKDACALLPSQNELEDIFETLTLLFERFQDLERRVQKLELCQEDDINPPGYRVGQSIIPKDFVEPGQEL